LLLAGLPDGIHGDVGDNCGEFMAMRRRPPTDTGKADLFLEFHCRTLQTRRRFGKANQKISPDRMQEMRTRDEASPNLNP
jgi:hypothetical protein